MENHSPKKSNSRKREKLYFLIPIIILVFIALASWSWLMLLSPAVSSYAEPYINKYFKNLIAGNASDTTVASSGTIGDSPEESEDGKNSGSSDQSDNTAKPENTGKESATSSKENSRPTIDLQIYEGPVYSAGDDTCYYRVKAVVTGNPKPQVKFSRDDSRGSLGPGTAQINLKRNSPSYALTATATNASGTAMDSIILNWGCNSNPVISEIKLSSDIIYVSRQYDLLVVATDPDGDKLSYKWAVSGGTLSADNSESVKWTAPATPDNYELKIEVSDSKGAKTSKSISVYAGTVAATETTAAPTSPAETTAGATTSTTEAAGSSVNLPKVASEGGYLEYGGQTYPGGNLYAGDSVNNKPCLGFISFNIASLSGKVVKSVSLSFSNPSVSGEPMAYLDSFWINVVDWGAEPIVQNDFNLIGIAIQSFINPNITCTSDNLKSELQKAINAGKSRFQIRVHFAGPYTDNDNAKDGWEYSQNSINLNVTYN
ncbi:MAG: hypothetical protein BWY60_00080 [Actinobacteria bacterium ADurb.Bin346]|nr:MAG: hypothetical protein BWY60_00080 [Actinobacteria bacterium ADurb.Bin346]